MTHGKAFEDLLPVCLRALPQIIYTKISSTMILRLLSEADRYGYEIVRLIAERSGGDYD